MDEFGVLGFCDERPLRARMDGNVQPQNLRGDERVVCRQMERHVAAHRRHAEHVAVLRGDEQRQRVVMTGVTVEDDAGFRHVYFYTPSVRVLDRVVCAY